MFNFLLLHVDIHLSNHPLLKDYSFPTKWSYHSSQGQTQLIMDLWVYFWTSKSIHWSVCLSWAFDKYRSEMGTFCSLTSTWNIVEHWPMLLTCQLAWVGGWHPPLRNENLKKDVHLKRRWNSDQHQESPWDKVTNKGPNSNPYSVASRIWSLVNFR